MRLPNEQTSLTATQSKERRGPAKCGLVVLTYNSKTPLYDCLRSAFEQTYSSLEVIVVDNHSRDGTAAMVKSSFPASILIELGENIGTLGENVGIERALADGCEYVLLVDSDAVLDPNVTSTLVGLMEADARIGIAGPSAYEHNRDGAAPVVRVNPRTGMLLTKRYVRQASETDCIGMALVRREVFERVGMIEPLYFAYFQDTDFSLRARRAGFKVYIMPEARFHHLGAYGTGRVPGLRGFVSVRNRCILIRRNFPRRYLLSVLWSLPAALTKVIGQWSASREWREVQCALLGTVAGVVLLATGREPRIFRRAAMSLMGYRVSMK